MAAQKEISNKYNALKLAGTDLGNPRSEVESSGSGGFVRKYQFGHIYWHANTGAHVVHGGILEAFLRYGGVGKHQFMPRDFLGYPISDEKQ
ncbi:MAG: esterase [Bacteroidetes bacterium]|nr:esterase [Bacteroidota bacterium]